MLKPPLIATRAAPAEWIAKPERGSQALLRLMVRLSIRLGRGASRALLYVIVAYFFAFAPGARRHARDYLRRALGHGPSARERFRHLLYFASCIHDRIYLIDEQYERFDISLEGEALMREQLQCGRGAFLMGAHMGSFEVMRSVGRRQPALHVTMAMYEENARKLAAILAAINPRAQPDIIALGHLDAMLRLAERLDRGAFVGVLADRTLGEESVQPVTLLGRRAYLPTGPMRVAAALRRPVIFMAGLYRGGNRYHVVFAPVADFSAIGAAARDSAVHAAIERYAALIERYCRSDPYNWFNFYDFWHEQAAKPIA